MEGLPEAAEIIKHRLCRGDFASCTRYQIFKSLGNDSSPHFLNATELEMVHKARRCLAEKQARQATPRSAGESAPPEEPMP
ncbi:hypothetical protein GMLC_44230 [Geomonas limicola]|uniref:Uncharacterized protein n=1 Tax=Geomonas limicola TaxID=2740186 RepID=A0A6V8NGI2_9BACT|nr:hypothetical protein [Geomonas limicola]GFO70844.1 hypothetical protein GMLC_44230 [Geomonas limicola]